jgi:hypothetical protein
MCTLWIDGFNGVAHHLRQRVNFAIIAEVGIGDLRRWGGCFWFRVPAQALKLIWVFRILTAPSTPASVYSFNRQTVR